MPYLPIVRALCAGLLLCAPAAFGFDLQGHRGARGLMPENTLPAFERALQVGVSTLELDIGITADGVVVVAHDPYLNPLLARDASGQWLPGPRGPLLKSLTLAQVQAHDVGRIQPGTAYARTFSTQQPRDGTRIPTLAQVFELVKARGADRVRFNIETKVSPLRPDETVDADAMVRALLQVIRAAGMADRVAIQSFDWRTLRLVQQLAPEIPTVALNNADTLRDPRWTAGLDLAEHGSVPRMVKAVGAAGWSPSAGTLDEAQVREALALGLQVVPYTVNHPVDMERLVAAGVTGLITDYPDRLREVLARRGLPLPAPVPP